MVRPLFADKGFMLRTSASLPLRVSQRATWHLNALGQRAFTNSQTVLATPGSSSSKSSTSHDTSRSPSAATRPVAEKNTESQPSTPQQHSPTTVAFVKGFAWLMGYKTKTSTAIRETRDAYALCAQRDVEEADFIQSRACCTITLKCSY